MILITKQCNTYKIIYALITLASLQFFAKNDDKNAKPVPVRRHKDCITNRWLLSKLTLVPLLLRYLNTRISCPS